MNNLPHAEPTEEITDIRDHTLCILETREECEGFVQALSQHGYPKDTITVLHGADGIRRFLEIMKGSLWGESAEAVLEDGKVELDQGRYLILIASAALEDAERIAALARSFRGRSVHHFGQLVDTRLTA